MSTVGDFEFPSALRRSLGKWNGSFWSFDSLLQKTDGEYVTSTKLEEIRENDEETRPESNNNNNNNKQQSKRHYILQRTTITTREGITSQHAFEFIPFANNKAKVLTTDSLFSNFDVEATGVSDDVVVVEMKEKDTGFKRLVDTVAVVGDKTRVRTTIKFTKDALLEAVVVTNEQRVLPS